MRIRIVSADVVKADLERGIVFLVYTLRSPVGDNHSAVDLSIADVSAMIQELLEAARQKAALLAEVFSGQKVSPERYQVADYKYTCDRLAPLLGRIADARRRHSEGAIAPDDLLRLETDGVHLLRPEFDLENKPDTERADILRKRAVLHMQQSDPQAARAMAQRALRLRPDDAESQNVLARCNQPA